MEDTLQQLRGDALPALLREIPDPPAHLYVRGTLPPDGTKLLSVVGSRKHTAYGKDVCEHLIAGLAGTPVTIVSGLALGIDAIAHRAALAAGLPTVAFPGSGLDWDALYPATNRELARRIVREGGALVSEFEPDFRATPYAFPQRNRLMAGYAHATLVIEAAERSGTLITARLAVDYNRDVLTVPGSIFSDASRGANQLIRLGATPVRSSADILDTLGIAPDATRERALPADISDGERELLELLVEPLPRDEIIQRMGIPARDANVIISSLELRGLIAEKLGVIHRAI